MKSFVVYLVLALSLGLTLAAPSQSATEIKEEHALQECNVTNPVQRNTHTEVGISVISGEKIDFTKEEKCFLLCYLQKVNFVNENADIKNGLRLVNHTIHSIPELTHHIDLVSSFAYLSNRAGKGLDDKCQKAFVIYHEYLHSIYGIVLAEALNKQVGVKEKIIDGLVTGKSVDKDISTKVVTFLDSFNAALTLLAKESVKQAEAHSQQQISV